MEVFINGIGAVSPQNSLNYNGEDITVSKGNRLKTIEPDYSHYIESKFIRRMSRLIKMSAASAFTALKDAGLEKTEGVISGTGLGCLEDTDSFLKKLVENKEEMLSPTAFIHSTHNTISAQIAYLLQCKGYNSTHVHRNISFESALLDAFLLIKEGDYNNILVGGADELIDNSFSILSRFGLFKENEAVTSENLFSLNSPGTIAGEGASYFSLSSERGNNCYGKISALTTLSFQTTSNAASKTKELLALSNITSPDLILTGKNGDSENDNEIEDFVKETGRNSPVANFKHLCGEYPTSSAFALWMAASAIKSGKIPFGREEAKQSGNGIKNVLIYNRFKQDHQSLILVTKC